MTDEAEEDLATIAYMYGYEKAKSRWVGLINEEEILDIAETAWGKDKLSEGRDNHFGFYVDFARAIEAILKERNT